MIRQALGVGAATLVAAVLSLSHRAGAQALPTGDNVVLGTSDPLIYTPNSMTLNQTSQQLATTWTTFDIGLVDTVQILQADPATISANKAIGGTPSLIEGNLFADRGLVLMNSAGVLFDTSSNVLVGNFVAGS